MRCLALTLLAAVLAFGTAYAAETKVPQVLFENVHVFNGSEDKLYENHSVLVEGKLIKAISAGEIEASDGATVIDGGGRTLMPGLIDAHVHLNLQLLANPSAIDGISSMTWEELGALAYESAQEYLFSGFTTVRDLCGAHDGLRRHVDAGLLSTPDEVEVRFDLPEARAVQVHDVQRCVVEQRGAGAESPIASLPKAVLHHQTVLYVVQGGQASCLQASHPSAPRFTGTMHL